MINETLNKYITEENIDNRTGLPDKFKVVDTIRNVSSGTPIKGNTYTITSGDKVALMAKNQGKDWFIVTTPILKLAFKDGLVVPVK